MPIGRALLVAMSVVLMVVGLCLPALAQQVETTVPSSQRVTIDLNAGVPNFVGNVNAANPTAAQSAWWYQNTNTSTTYSSKTFVESTDTAASWIQVGVPYDANIYRSFLNQQSGGGDGSLNGGNNWYRLHFKVDPSYSAASGKKIMVEFEGAQVGAQVYINGTLLAGSSAVTANAQASHVIGFIPFLVDLTPYVTADGSTDNVLAVQVSRNGPTWFEAPGFSEGYRFGQGMAGLFRPVKMFITSQVHIPVNVYSNQKTWGTYVATVSEVPNSNPSVTATAASAVISVETNVLNETTAAANVTLTTQIVDAVGNVVVTAPPVTQSVNPLSASNLAPSGPTGMFVQQITVPNPTLWYPNNSIYGTPYMYTVYHIVSVNGVVVDATQSPLGIRTITWDSNYPYFNGHQMNLWGGSGRYDYPALGSSVPEEQQWRDLQQMAAAGGNIWRPGHSSSSEEFVQAADAYGIMIDQPSGDGEEHWATLGGTYTADDWTLKNELHRDMIVRDRNHPSILDWESNNGTMNETAGLALIQLDKVWDPINPRVAADRTPDPVNGTILGCTLEGCEVAFKTGTGQTTPGGTTLNNPAFGMEYWGNGSARGLAWDYELQFVAPFLNNWQNSKAAGAFGIAQWYFADTPGEDSNYMESFGATGPYSQGFVPAATTAGNQFLVRSLGASMVDMNRFPKLLYYAYEAAWTPYALKPMVALAHHWNRSGTVQVNAFSNCPSVRLLLNGSVYPGTTDQIPNAWNVGLTTQPVNNLNPTNLPMEAHWNVTWQSGTIAAVCLNSSANPVTNASGAVVEDTRTTAGAENKIVLTVVPELTRPNGTAFQVKANGSDAAFVVAQVEDANGNIVPTAADNITFSVSGPATYMGGAQQYVTPCGSDSDTFTTNLTSNPPKPNFWAPIGGLPNCGTLAYEANPFFHAPGDPQLQAEGGLTKIALRSQFTAGTVTVTASATGLTSGTATFTTVALPDPRPVAQAPVIIVPPVNVGTTAGYTAALSVTASGSGTLTYQWYSGCSATAAGTAISGATTNSYTTPVTTTAQNGTTYCVKITDSVGAVTSSPVTLTVAAAQTIAITTQPASTSAIEGQTGTVSVVATGSPTLSYQWYENGAAIAYANQSSYTTPVLTATGTNSFYVVITNPLGSVTSATATLTVVAPTPVAITAQPQPQAVMANHPVQFCVTASGSSPITYQWYYTPQLAGSTAQIIAGDTASCMAIQQVQTSNVGGYSVIVNNAANVPVTSAVAGLSIAPPGTNIALYKTATAATTQQACTNSATTPPYSGTEANACLGAENAVDGIGYTYPDGTQGSRWSSSGAAAAANNNNPDTDWIQIDLGSVQPFNTVVLLWEAAYAAQYSIEYTSTDPSTNPTWSVAVTNNTGQGSTETLNFPTVQARYVRMQGIKRATTYGYSLFEFQIYNISQCGGSAERYTLVSSTASSANPLVQDNQTGLTWTQTELTNSGVDAQFDLPVAQTACTTVNGSTAMSVPTLTEAQAIAGMSDAACAFPGAWQTWTITPTTQSGYYSVVNFSGAVSSALGNNSPGAVMCTMSTSGAPVIGTQPVPVTTPVGTTATYSVVVTTPTTPTYQWYRNSAVISGATASSYTTPSLTASNNGDNYYAVVTNTKGTATSASASLTIGTPCATAPPAPTAILAGTVTTTTISMSWTAGAAPSGCSISGYTIYRSTSSGSQGSAVGTSATASFTDTGLTQGTTYYYQVVETDGATNPSAASTQVAIATSNGTTPTTDILAINSGGATITGSPFVADVDFTGGGTAVSTNSVTTTGIANAAPMAVYQSERSGAMTYTIPGLTTGTSYGVRLHFAETYFTAAGQRVFNVAINGTSVLANFDIFAKAGANAALVESFTATAVNGQIVIAFTAGSADQPKVSGIEIYSSTPVVAPVITTQPAAATVTVGQTATFNVVATGSGTLTYQWSKSGVAISGATAASYTTPATAATDNGSTFSVVVTNSGGSVTSANAVLNVSGATTDFVAINAGGATITGSSFVADEDFTGGGAAVTTNTIAVTGIANAAPMAVYQSERSGVMTYTIPGLTTGTSYGVRLHFAEFYWTAAGQRVFNIAINGTTVLPNFDIIAKAGAANTALVVPLTTTAVNGQIVIAFTAGSADQPKVSGIEILSSAPVVVAPTITTQPAAATVAVGQTATFSVVASGTGTLTYQWSKNGTAISGATAASYTTPATASTDNGAKFTVVVTNAGGSVTSNSALLTVTTTAPTITTQPAAASVNVGQTATFSVVASGTGTLTYQWSKSGTAISGATAASYTTPATASTDTGAKFTVVVTNAGGSVTSNSALLTVNTAGPAITTQPAAQTVTVGQTATFSIVASGTGTLTYQWSKSGAAISGATAASYTTPATAATDNGATFSVVVTNAGGSVSSNTALLTVTGATTDIVAINAGGAAIAGSSFVADEDFTGGGAAVTTNAIATTGIANAAPMAVYQSERSGAMTYTIGGLTTGTSYSVRLHFAEFYWTAAGQRIFNVAINGTTVLPNFDIIAKAGAANTALVVPLTATAANSQIVIAFTAGSADQPKVSGIEILGAAAAPVTDVVAINSGGAAIAGSSFVADEDFTGGGAAVTTNTIATTGIANSAPMAVYQSERSGAMTYTIGGLTTGTSYGVRLHFAEFYWTAVGQRIFNVAINGTSVLPNFDIIAKAGAANTAVVEPFTATAVNGQIVIAFTAGSADQPKVSGIEILNSGTVAAPTITTQPTAATVTVGQTDTFSVVASGGGTLTYQWSKNGTAISGATAASYTTPATALTDNGSSFAVAVTNAGGSVTSNAAVLTVVSAGPSITTQPAPQTVTVGKTATFSVVASGTGTITYQWSKNSTAISGATAASYTTPATATTDNGALFSVVVTNSGGSTASNTALLTVTSTTGPPTIATQPVSQTVTIGKTATFSVTASGASPFTYQWSKNGTAIAGAVAATYISQATSAPDNGAKFSVVVTNSGGSVTSANAVMTVNSSPVYTIYPGFIGIDLNNNTRGAFADNQIYVEVLGTNITTNALSWVNYDGTVNACSLADNTASNAVTGPDGKTYPAYGFTLAQASHLLKLPPLNAGRIYISLGAPMYVPIEAGNPLGYAGPNPLNTTDPNTNTNYDWYEFDWGGTADTIWINTTQVDMFGLPLVLDLWASSETYHMQTGITESVATIDKEYAAQTPAIFQASPVSPLRIWAPAHTTFGVGQANGNYFDSYVNSVWSEYASTPLVVLLNNNSREFSGTTSGTTINFTEVNLNNGAYGGAGTYTINKPTTQDLLLCAGSMATGSGVTAALEAQFCAAFNRHVMDTYSDWAVPADYYLTAPTNYYSAFWHAHSIGGLSYGFAYDDVNNQSSSIVEGNPEHMAFGIGW